MSGKPSAVHNLSHTVKLSANMGYLLPIALYDCIPGDNFEHEISALIRTQPLLAPVMHEVDIDIHAYFVPDRLVQDNAEEFQSGGDDGATTATWAYMAYPTTTGYAVGTLADYYGLPTGTDNPVNHDAKPIRGYNLIWNYHYRDSQLQSEIAIDLTDGLDTTTPKNLLAVAWKRDYFTKCRPEPQLGAEVVIPLGGNAPVESDGTQIQLAVMSGTNFTDGDLEWTSTTANRIQVQTPGSATNPIGVKFGANTGLLADLSAVTGIPVRDLREAGAMQRVLEGNNIFGGRYMEQLEFRFGVRPQDARLQWPEFLGAGHTKVQFSEVLATAETGATVDVGDMKGHGISILGSNKFSYHVKEHGYIHVFIIMRPKTQYFQGQHRMWSRETRFDYLLPEFVHIGDQSVPIKELYADAADPNLLFGYTPIYEEYRTIPSRVAGEFRSTLKYWHMAREFSSEPALNATFIACNPTNRIYATAAAAQVYCNIKHDIKARRLLPHSPQYRLM